MCRLIAFALFLFFATVPSTLAQEETTIHRCDDCSLAEAKRLASRVGFCGDVSLVLPIPTTSGFICNVHIQEKPSEVLGWKNGEASGSTCAALVTYIESSACVDNGPVVVCGLQDGGPQGLGNTEPDRFGCGGPEDPCPDHNFPPGGIVMVDGELSRVGSGLPADCPEFPATLSGNWNVFGPGDATSSMSANGSCLTVEESGRAVASLFFFYGGDNPRAAVFMGADASNVAHLRAIADHGMITRKQDVLFVTVGGEGFEFSAIHWVSLTGERFATLGTLDGDRLYETLLEAGYAFRPGFVPDDLPDAIVPQRKAPEEDQNDPVLCWPWPCED